MRVDESAWAELYLKIAKFRRAAEELPSNLSENAVVTLIFCLAMMTAGVDGPTLDAGQLLDLIRDKSRPLKSMSFVYEGQMNYVGDPSQLKGTSFFGEEFQGTFLYRNDNSFLYDLYHRRLIPEAGVVRSKMSILRGVSEKLEFLLDAQRPIDPNSQVVRGKGANFQTMLSVESPHDLLLQWKVVEALQRIPELYRQDGWEEVDGRHCLRVRFNNAPPPDDNLNYSLYWLDMEHGAQVVRFDTYWKGHLAARFDHIVLQEFQTEDGTKYWLPISCDNKLYFNMGTFFDNPCIERSSAVVHGSVQVNVDLPDSLFTVLRDSALPARGEAEGTEKASKAGALRRRFETQTPPAPEPPLKTDSVSVRRKIDERLAEANRQSEELRASSAAQASSAWVPVLPWGLAALGVGLSAAGLAWKWRAG